jgi:hypothetical protein
MTETAYDVADDIRRALSHSNKIECFAEDDGYVFIALNEWGGSWPVSEAQAIRDLIVEAKT